jgi:hypothetical protein
MLHTARRYLNNRREQLNYQGAIKRELPQRRVRRTLSKVAQKSRLFTFTSQVLYFY